MSKSTSFKSGKYELIKQLGKGAFGTVYLVEDKDNKKLYIFTNFTIKNILFKFIYFF